MKKSYFIKFNFSEFSYNNNPFFIRIGGNFFSKNKIILDINDIDNSLNIRGRISFSESKNISTNVFSPNIMGPFCYFSCMQCNHAILSMNSFANGSICLNNKFFNFNNGCSYIEKDWGTSFPSSYIWCQGNEFFKSNSNFMLSVAKVPFSFINFSGIICDLCFDGKEYKFATYYGSKLITYNVSKSSIFIEIIQKNRTLIISSNSDNAYSLLAPSNGKMNKEIRESISSKINIQLKENNKVIFSDYSVNCGLEIVI